MNRKTIIEAIRAELSERRLLFVYVASHAHLDRCVGSVGPTNQPNPEFEAALGGIADRILENRHEENPRPVSVRARRLRR